MAVFAVISLSEPQDAVGARVIAQFPNDHYFLAPGRWLVSGEGIAKEISDKLGDGSLGLFVVFAVSGYFGWATNTLWEWMALKASSAKHV